MAVKETKLLKWGPYNRTKEGHRTYKVTYQVTTDDNGSGGLDFGDGPAVIRQAAGLSQVGSPYSFGNDSDLTAFCTPEMTIKPDQINRGERPIQFLVEQTFSSIPNNRCQDDEFEDPLQEPQKVSGTFNRIRTETFVDKDGNIIKSSSHELIRGSEMEIDENKPTVQVVQNVAALELALVTSLIAPRSNVSDSVMWGVAAGGVKFSSFDWVMKFYGTCDYYFTRTLGFEIDFNGWNNREVLDRGTRVLFGEFDSTGRWWIVKDLPNGGGAPDADNPLHFIRFKDQQGENRETLLDGTGLPYDGTVAGVGTGGSGDVGTITLSHYPESDLFQLGIPVDIEVPN